MTSPFLPDDVARCPGVTIAPVAGANQPQVFGVLMIECRDCLRRTAPANDPTRVLVMDPPIRALMASIISTDMSTTICDHRIESLEAGATCPHIVSSDEGTSYCRLAKQTQDKLDRLIELDRAKPAPADSLVEQNAPTTEDFLMGAPNALRAVRDFGREIGAAQIARSADSPPVKNHPSVKESAIAAPAGSLVERVAAAMGCNHPAEWSTEARAAIREVAAWLDERDTSIQNQPGCLEAPFADDAVRWLRREADR